MGLAVTVGDGEADAAGLLVVADVVVGPAAFWWDVQLPTASAVTATQVVSNTRDRLV
ncbi:MAG TPA: hypothetical protein VGH11_08555 [Jatrophihabitans sp.]|jgi:hypothetical protein